MRCVIILVCVLDTIDSVQLELLQAVSPTKSSNVASLGKTTGSSASSWVVVEDMVATETKGENEGQRE